MCTYRYTTKLVVESVNISSNDEQDAIDEREIKNNYLVLKSTLIPMTLISNGKSRRNAD